MDEEAGFYLNSWEPKTDLGRAVKSGEIKTLEQVFYLGKRIEELEIIDMLMPNLKNEIIEISTVQRMTKNNRKMKFRAVAIVGDENGHVGIGAGKNIEVKAAIDSAIINAKKNIIPIILGCGSWQCLCGTKHSLPLNVKGKAGSVEVILKPAPKGLGIVANKHVKKMLELSGLKDIWSFSRGRTRARYNTLLAVFRALESINKMKNIADFDKEKHIN